MARTEMISSGHRHHGSGCLVISGVRSISQQGPGCTRSSNRGSQGRCSGPPDALQQARACGTCRNDRTRPASTLSRSRMPHRPAARARRGRCRRSRRWGLSWTSWFRFSPGALVHILADPIRTVTKDAVGGSLPVTDYPMNHVFPAGRTSGYEQGCPGSSTAARPPTRAPRTPRAGRSLRWGHGHPHTLRPHTGLRGVLRGRWRWCECWALPLESSAPLPPSADDAQSDEGEEEGRGLGDRLGTAAK
jgi:hypothetical protein